MLLADAKKLIREIIEADFEDGDYGANIEYAKGCKCLFEIAINDWRGNEKTVTAYRSELKDSAKLKCLLHEVIETLATLRETGGVQ